MAWLAGVGVVVVLAPIWAADIIVLMPLTMLYLMAGGPLYAFAKQPPSCRACGLARPSPGRIELLCRPVRALPHARLAARQAALASRPLPIERDEESGVRRLPTPRSREP